MNHRREMDPPQSNKNWRATLWFLNLLAFAMKLRTISFVEPRNESTPRRVYVVAFRMTLSLMVALNVWLGVQAIRLANVSGQSAAVTKIASQIVIIVLVTAIQLLHLLRQRLFRSTMKQVDQLCSNFIGSEPLNDIRRRTTFSLGIAAIVAALFMGQFFTMLFDSSLVRFRADTDHVNQTLLCLAGTIHSFCYDLKVVYLLLSCTALILRLFGIHDVLCLFTGCEILKACITALKDELRSSSTNVSTCKTSSASTCVNESVTQFLSNHRKCTSIIEKCNTLFQQQISLYAGMLVVIIIMSIRALDFMSDDFWQNMADIDMAIITQNLVIYMLLVIFMIKWMADVNSQLIGCVTSVADAEYASLVGKRMQKTSKLVDEELTLYMEQLSTEPPGLQINGSGIVDNGYILDIGLTILAFSCIVYGL